jgi:alkanesulfonate monooxygenase
MRLRFHWSLSSVGETMRRANAAATHSGVPDMAAHKQFALRAEEFGIESLLMAFGFSRPDPVTWAAALGSWTRTVKFLVAVRSGIVSPTYFVQQVNTLSALTGGRVCVNVVAGRAPDEQRFYGDFLQHDERYERTDEFWSICHALWRDDGPVDFCGKYYQVEGATLRTPFVSPDRARPEIYLGGSSDLAVALAIRHADCMFTLPDAPDQLAARIRPLLDNGTDVGLLVSLICRPTHEEAVDAAYTLIHAAGARATAAHRDARRRTDSVGFGSLYDRAMGESQWPTPYLWVGAVPYLGAPSVALVGSPDEIVDALAAYEAIGVTQFLFMGYPDLDELTFFGAEILPRVRALEPTN